MPCMGSFPRLILKSDHFGIEMNNKDGFGVDKNVLKSDHFGIEMEL